MMEAGRRSAPFVVDGWALRHLQFVAYWSEELLVGQHVLMPWGLSHGTIGIRSKVDYRFRMIC